MHSHTTLENLIRQAEKRAEQRQKKDLRPGWLKEFIYDSADLFEPLADTARVGYDCRFREEGWQVLFYLGESEIFGGKHDGRRTRIAFEFDLKSLLDCFKRVDSLKLRALNDDLDLTLEDHVMVEIVGSLKETETDEVITVGILSSPPLEAGAALRLMPNGAVEPI